MGVFIFRNKSQFGGVHVNSPTDQIHGFFSSMPENPVISAVSPAMRVYLLPAARDMGGSAAQRPTPVVVLDCDVRDHVCDVVREECREL